MSWQHRLGLAILAPRPFFLHIPIRIVFAMLVAWGAVACLAMIGGYLIAMARLLD